MITINLLPPRRRRRFVSALPSLLGLGRVFGGLCVLGLLGIGAYWFVLDREARTLEADMRRLDGELAQHKMAIVEGTRFKKEKEELERRVAVIDVIARNQARPVYLLDALADMIPRELWLTSLEEKEKVLKITGTAFSSRAVSDFMANLKNSGKFRDVDLIVSRQDLTKAPSIVTFEVTCRFEI